MPSQVDFYILDQPATAARLHFCGRLIMKALTHNQRCSLLVEDAADARELDDLLWQSPPESFIPHSVATDSQSAVAGSDPVIIIPAPSAPADTVCINLRQRAPDNHADIQRLVEIVCQDPAVLETTREKYRFYRQLGYPLQSHSIKAGA